MRAPSLPQGGLSVFQVKNHYAVCSYCLDWYQNMTKLQNKMMMVLLLFNCDFGLFIEYCKNTIAVWPMTPPHILFSTLPTLIGDTNLDANCLEYDLVPHVTKFLSESGYLHVCFLYPLYGE